MTIKKSIILALSTLTFIGCTSDEEVSQEQSRLPLTFEINLSGSRPVTRAVGSQFEKDDMLLCYVRHVSGNEAVQSKLVTIQNDEPTESLYWDDFSVSTGDGSKDLRTKGHGLQSYYGYCYNGGTPTTALVETTGVLGWTTADDQRVVGVMKANDLLWSAEQLAITYDHARDAHGTLTVPYTHAMSKFTIVVVAGKGFQSADLNAASVTLKGMSQKGLFSAPSTTVTSEGTTAVKMYANAISTTTDVMPCRAYEAVTVPKTLLTSGALLATIENMDGNNYEVRLTDTILEGWKDGIKEEQSQSGVNYKLTITLNKQAISVVATLADWTNVSAAGIGEILFDADIKSINVNNATGLKTGDSFSLWMTANETDYGTLTTTAEYDGSKFVNTPAIYWPNGSDSFFFRALAQKTASKTLEAVTTMSVAQGTDLLWGTTAEHVGTEADGKTTHDYAEGAAINPRTGQVPLTFKHAMCNVVVNLETSSDASAVDLKDAVVTLTSLHHHGTVNIATGVIAHDDTPSDKTLDGEAIMLPQEIGDNTKLKITLADGTTYSLLLNQCEDASGKAVARWQSGNKYTYTISLKKEQIQFRALVEDWIEKTGSGNATLDWD